jgi:3-phenylpropionate/trans-cinnamate dioxygenase ferredoxin reductase subunit
MPGRIVILGAGHAGVECATALRARKFGGTVDLVGDDPHLPYQRPPLSKDYIKRPGDPLPLKPKQFFADNRITLRPGQRAAGIDRKRRQIRLESGEALPYDHLVLATGARNRRLHIPGINDGTAFELRTLADADRILGSIRDWRQVAIVGGGVVGLEAAALLTTKGIAVHVIETAPRLMQRTTSPTLSSWFAEWHWENGTAVHLDTQVAAVEQEAARVVARLTDGNRLVADAAIVAAGVLPNVELAAAAGLAVGNGIVVDANLLTSDPAISAIGDCANFPSSRLPGRARLESVQNATDQARTVAARLTGETKPYDDTLPWFWSIQGGVRLQIAGLSKPGLSEVVRGDPDSGRFSVFLFDGERLTAVESVNAAADHMIARRLIAERRKVEPAGVGDLSLDLKSLL